LPSAVAPGFSGQADDTQEGVVAEPDAMCGAPLLRRASTARRGAGPRLPLRSSSSAPPTALISEKRNLALAPVVTMIRARKGGDHAL
jgi:hypothetical protein